MVQLVEVEDEHFQAVQPGPEEEDGDYTDTDSEISGDSQFDASKESLPERLYALRNMIPPSARWWFWGQYQTARRLSATAVVFLGRAAWHVTVTALILGVPFAISYSEEQQLAAMEQEQRMRDIGSEMLTAGVDGGDTAAQVGAALAGGDGGGGGAVKPAL